MTETYGAQLISIKLPQFETEILKFICQRLNSLYNQAIYFVRRNQEMTHPGLLPFVSYGVLCSELKDEWNYSMLCAQAAQQTLKSVTEAIDGYKGLMSLWWSGGLEIEPHIAEIQEAWWTLPGDLPSVGSNFLS